MNIKRLDSGYMHLRLDANRFAQWPCWERLTLDQCSPQGWWTQAEVDAVNEMIDNMMKQDDGQAYKEARKAMPTIRDCNTCRHADIDSKDDPCFSCQSVDAHRYRSWQPVVVHPVLGPYLVKSPSLEVYRSMGITTADGADRSVSYINTEDVYIIQGKRYAAGIFEALLRVGDTFKVVDGAADTVTVRAVQPAVLAEWQKRQLVQDMMVEWRAGSIEDNVLVLIDKVLDAIGRRDNAA